LTWVESYRKLALLPEGAAIIDPQGEACGFYLRHDQVSLFFLPGVPDETRCLAVDRVMPLLLKTACAPQAVRQRLFKFSGPQEAEIGETLADLGREQAGITVGFYPNFPETHVVVTVRAGTEAEATDKLASLETEVEKRLGCYLVAKDASTLEENIGDLLRRKGLTVAVAESCTGGLISQRLTSISGSSDYFDRGLVTYSNHAKQELLGVPAEIIEQQGAVSAACAEVMARSVREKSGTDIGLSSKASPDPAKLS
jgi:nicotinamide-nucleotide amidase